MPLMVIDRSGGAAQQRVASQEMLVAMDRHRAPLGQAGPDAVGAFPIFAPTRAGPQSPGAKCRVVAGRAAPLDRNAVAVRQQHAASNAADAKIKPVEAWSGDGDE